ncbi:tape measure protein [uncultured Bacteroides sp.]|uniref:tape measure protein n=1 Tax=uncultured Bacteroides sp. TaxID=162156 RepID=UPI002AA68C2C|nr:tape measure protein [uncultured Bacteroides sp.]
MANNNLNFAVAINLLSENFKKGVIDVKTSLNSIKSTALQVAGVFGLGLGLKASISKMIEIAKETGTVQRALKDASGSALDYAKNQEYLNTIANKYRVNLNSITESYAKFTASAKLAGISNKDQQSLFEGLTASFKSNGMSGDKQNVMLDSMSKLFIKNNIQIKPLIATFAESPKLLGLMATAMGTTVEGLKDMSKHGKLLSSDVMPKFADQLKKTFSKVDTTSISSSMNDIANSWIALTKKLEVGNIYKKIANGFADSFKYIVTNFDDISRKLIDVVGTIWIGKMFNTIKAQYNAITLAAEQSYVNQAIAARKSTLEQELLSSTLSKKKQSEYVKQEVAATKAYASEEFAATKYSNTASFAYTKLTNSIKAMFKAFAPMLIISGLIELTQRTIEYYKSIEKARNIYKDFQSQSSALTVGNEEIVKLKSLLSIYNDKSKSASAVNNAQTEMLKMLGVEKQHQTDINKLVGERIKLIEAGARVDFDVQQKLQAQKEITSIFAKYGGKEGLLKKVDSDRSSKGILTKNFQTEADIDLTKIKQNTKVIKTIDTRLPQELALSSSDNYTVGTPAESKHKLSKLEQAEKDYNDNLIIYSNQLAAGIINQNKHNQLVDDLNKKSAEELGGLLGNKAKDNSVYQKAKSGIDHPTYTGKMQVDDYMSVYNKDIDNIKQKNAAGYYKDADEYKDALSDATKSTIDNIASIKGLDVASNATIKSLIEYNKTLQKVEKIDYSLPVKQKVDTTFDYKTTNEDKAIDKYNQNKDYINNLQNKLEDIGKTKGVDDIIKKIQTAKGDYNSLVKDLGSGSEQLIVEFDNAIVYEKDLRKSLQLTEIRNDIKNFNKELNEGLYSTSKDLVNSFLDLRDAWQSVGDAFNHHQSSMQKILTIWNALTGTIDRIISLTKQLNQLEKLSNTLSKAKGKESLIKSGKDQVDNVKKGSIAVDHLMSLDEYKSSDKGTDKELKNVKELEAGIKGLSAVKKTEAAIDNTLTATKVANSNLATGNEVVNTATELTTSTAKITANTAVAGTEAVKSTAGLPFPANLIAAGSAVAAILALISSLPKFANGGIIGGGSISGDKLLARVNSGEMILNQGQQSTLFGLLNGRNNGTTTTSTGGGKVEFRIDGKSLKGVLDNYNNIKGKVK